MTLFTADCETDPFEHNTVPVPFIWGLYDGTTFSYYYNVSEFVEKLKSLGKGATVYFHNGGKFDFHFLIGAFESRVKVVNNRLVSAYVGNTELRDSYSILPISLGKYKKDKFDYSKLLKKNRDNFKQDIIDYLKSDCVNLFTLTSAFLKNYDSKLTIASAALNEYKKLGGVVPRSSKAFYDTYSQYYMGGRVECLESGEISGNITHIDINSAYPYAMLHKHPIGTAFYKSEKWNYNGYDFLTILAKSKGAIVQKNKNGIYVLTEEDGYNILRTTGWEVLASLNHNLLNIKKIISVLSPCIVNDFNTYVNTFYEKKNAAREIGDDEEYLFAKLFLNSLYGKFGQNPEKFKNFRLIELKRAKEFLKKGYTIENVFNGYKALVSKPSSNGKYYNVATSASITGFVRAEMLSAINTVDTPLYCDTDSIFFLGDSNGLKIGNNIGEWKTVNHYNKMFIAGKKLYAAQTYDGKWNCATKGANLKPNDIIKLTKKELITYKPSAPIFSLKKGIYFSEKIIKNTC